MDSWKWDILKKLGEVGGEREEETDMFAECPIPKSRVKQWLLKPANRTTEI